MNQHVTRFCKPGQGHACCRYLITGAGGFECAKVDDDIKRMIDKRDNMVAKGDNCAGRSNLNDEDDLSEKTIGSVKNI